MDKPQTVTLDTTLAELYAIDGKDGENPPHLAIYPVSYLTTFDMGEGYERNSQYPTQDFLVADPDLEGTKEKMGGLFKMAYLNVITQRDTFAAGPMEVIFITFDEADGTEPQSKYQVESTRSSVHPSQRMRPLYISNPTQLPALIKEQTLGKLILRAPYAGLRGLDMAIDMDTHYFLNTKAAIATSGLPTPRSTVIQLGPQGFDAMKCCEFCAANPFCVSMPTDCTGPRQPWMKQQIDRALNQIQARVLPFVLKTQQSLSGICTFIIETEEERQTVVEKLKTWILPKILSDFTPSNSHLNPASLVMMDFIDGLIGNWGLTIFVTQKGRTIFLGASEQRLADRVRWKGSVISFPDQAALEEKFKSLIEQIGNFVHSYGYYGPLGVDVLEVAKGRNGMATTDFFVVDINARFSGSLNLVLLKKHLSEQRGLHIASSFFVQSEIDRSSLIEKLPRQFEEGRILFTSWYHNPQLGGFGSVIIAGEDHDAVVKTTEELWAHAHELQVD